MNPQLPLADIHQLDAVGNWPPAIGWWLLLLVLLALFGGGSLALWRRYQTNRLLRLSLQQLAQLQPEQLQASQINQLLKRHLRSLAINHPALAMSGSQWQAFLQAQLSQEQQVQITPLVEQLGEALYRQSALELAQAEALLSATRYWLKQSWPQLRKGGANAAI